MRLHVVDAGHEQDLAHRRARPFARQHRGRAFVHLLRGRQRQPKRVAVAVLRQVQEHHARSVRRFPQVFGARAVEAPPEHRAVEAEAAQELRHLGYVAEGVGDVPRAHGPAEALRDAVPARQVAHQRLAADQELVGHHVPRAHQQAAGRDVTPQALLLLGAHVQVVFEHHRLAVEMEREGGVRFQQVEHAVHEVDQPQAELFVCQVPLAVPVRVRDDVNLQAHPFTAPAVSPATK